MEGKMAMEIEKVLGSYQNGNYMVTILSDGTKIRETIDPDATAFMAEFPESMDIKITNKCSEGCEFCHENSTSNGLHGDILNLPFIDELKPYTELAMGGGNPLSHPDLIPFLTLCKERKLIPNITINQRHFENPYMYDQLRGLVKKSLIYGVGVSVINPTPNFIKHVKQIPNAVLHVISGVITREQLDALSGHGLKMLILGYKYLRRGVTFYEKNTKSITQNQQMLMDELRYGDLLKRFGVVSFDNLAIEQLEVKSWLPKRAWDEFFQGDDGTHTMYVDCVNGEFATSSTLSDTRRSFDEMTLSEYFKRVAQKYKPHS